MAIAQLIWAAVRPVLRVALIMAIGVFLTRSGQLTQAGTKCISKILVNVLYPCLLFVTLAVSINDKNINRLGILTAASVYYVLLGTLLGLFIRYFTKPPLHFRNGTVMAVSGGNYGDLTLAVIMSLGTTYPFTPEDTQKGVAYVIAFLCFFNFYYFSYAFQQFAADMKHLPKRPPSLANAPTELTAIAHMTLEIEDDTDRISIKKKTWKLRLETIKESPIYIALVNNSNFALVLGLMLALIPSFRSIIIPESLIESNVRPPISQEPPLFFLYELLEFLGRAAVPIGLINLGSALGRLKLGKVYVLKTAISIALSKLLIIPVLSIGLIQLLTFHTSLIPPEDKMLRFVLMFQGCVPTGALSVFFTQYWHPEGEANEISFVMAIQYLSLFITLSISTCFILFLLS